MNPTSDSSDTSSALPPGVHPLTFGDIERMGVGPGGELYWDGRPVVTRRRFDLSRWQTIGAVLVAIAAGVGGLGSAMAGIDAGYNFGCRVHWWSTGCPR